MDERDVRFVIIRQKDKARVGLTKKVWSKDLPRRHKALTFRFNFLRALVTSWQNITFWSSPPFMTNCKKYSSQ